MTNQPKEEVRDLIDDVQDYVNTRLDLFKLKAVNASSEVLASLVTYALLVLIFTIFFLMVNIGIGLYLGELLGRSFYGFLALSGFYLLIMLIFWALRKKVFKNPIADSLIQKLTD